MKKNINYKPFSATKSIKVMVMFIFFSVFLIGSVSAFEFDNKLIYSENDLKINLTNWFGLGIDYGTAKLESHESVTQVKNVLVGKQVVMWYDFNFTEIYFDGLGDVEFINMKTNEKIGKDYSFVYQTNENYEENVYENQCSILGNGTKYCNDVIIGKEIKTRYVWKPYNTKDIPKGNIRIGLLTNVKKGDYIDGIWTIGGKKVTKHALWTGSAGLVSYWKFDETSGLLAVDEMSTNNGTIFSNVSLGVEGIIETAYNFTGGSFFLGTTSTVSIGGNISIQTWLNPEKNLSDEWLLTDWSAPERNYILIFKSNKTITFTTGNGASGGDEPIVSTGALPLNEWTHIITTRDVTAGNLSIYINGRLNQSRSITSFGGTTTNNITITGGTPGADIGRIDEVGFWNRTLSPAEILDLYNGGLGCIFGDEACSAPPVVTLNSPTDNFETANQTVIFNGTAQDVSGNDIVNVSLYLNDVLNETNSSGINNTDYIFTKILAFNTYTWTYEVCNNASFCVNATSRILNISNFVENEVIFNANTFETASETFTTNITTNGIAPTSASLIYNGIEFTGATITDFGGNNYNISRTIDIPLINGNIPFHFNFSLGGTEVATDDTNQSVNLTTFEFCEIGEQPAYINFTFTNETVAEEAITAEIDTTWNFWLGSGTVMDSLTFANTTENSNYQFCLSSGGNRTLNANVSLTYNNLLSQLRSFRQEYVLTNTTTTQSLFLLPTADGIFVTFQVVDPAEQVISGVFANATKEGNIISSGITDDAGLITYFLDPDTTYVFSFSKEGFTTVTTTLVPTQTSFTIIMGTITTISQFDTTRGINYIINPIDLTLLNNTLINFNLTLNSSFHSLEQFGFVLRNSTGTVFNTTTSTTDTGGFLSQTLDTGSNTDIIMEVFWTITGNQTNVTKVWLVFNSENEGFSILTFFNDLSTYLTSGLFGLTDFGLGIIVFLIILISTGIVSFRFGITSPPGISIIVFSLVAFFDVALGIMPNPINAIPNFPTIFVGLIFLGTLYSEAIR